MKILIISQYYPPEIGAAATRWSEYGQIMQDLGHDLTILTELPNYPSGIIAEGYPRFWFHEDKRRPNKPRIIRVPVWANSRNTTLKRLGFYLSFMASATIRALFLPRYDMIIVSSPPLFVGLIASFLRPFKHSKYALDLRDIWPESAHVLGEIKSMRMLNFGRLLERIVYRSVDVFLLAVPGFKEYLNNQHSDHISKQKLILMNGVSQAFINMLDSANSISLNERFTVLFSGNIGLAQGLETVLQAAKLLNNVNIEFVLIGDGTRCEALKLQAESLQLSNVTFIPSMSRNKLIEQIMAAHICLVPLVRSPLFLNAIPSKLLEYMAAGKPVIVGIRGEVEALLKKSGAGVSIAPEDSRALAETIMEYKNNPERVMKEGVSGKKFIRNSMTKEGMLEEAMLNLAK